MVTSAVHKWLNADSNCNPLNKIKKEKTHLNERIVRSLTQLSSAHFSMAPRTYKIMLIFLQFFFCLFSLFYCCCCCCCFSICVILIRRLCIDPNWYGMVLRTREHIKTVHFDYECETAQSNCWLPCECIISFHIFIFLSLFSACA